jgi:hypothetical protein
VELAGSAPQNVRWSDAGKKRSQAVDRRAAGCNLLGVVLSAEKRPSASKLQNSNTFFSHARTSISRCLCFGLKMRCASFYFERSCPEQHPRAALKPQASKSPTRAGPGPGPRAPPPRSSRVVESPWSPIKFRSIFFGAKEVGSLLWEVRKLAMLTWLHYASPVPWTISATARFFDRLCCLKKSWTAAVVSCRSYLCSREGGPHTALTPDAP